VLSYDLRAEAAGGDTVESAGPHIGVLHSDGVLSALELPSELDGIGVPSDVLPLTAAADGTLYVWDGSAARVLERTAAGEWNVAVAVPAESLYGPPRAAVGPTGDLFVQTAASVVQVDRAGAVARVVGTGFTANCDGCLPETPIGTFPREATAQAMPLLSGLVVADDGTIYVATGATVLAVADGQLSLVADPGTTSADGEGAIAAFHDAGERQEGSVLTALAIDVDGSLLVGDSGFDQRILRIHNGHSEVLLGDVSWLFNGIVVTRSVTRDLLFMADGSSVLVAYGR